MIIGIDGNEANIERKVGVNQYGYEILWGLYRLNVHLGRHKFVIYLKEGAREDLPKETVHWKYKILPGEGFWIIKKLTPFLWKKSRPDVFFSPSHYLPFATAIPKVFTLHDLGYLMFSDQFKKYDYWQLKYWTAISIYISKYIITVSESSRDDIVRHYPFASKKISVIYHGYNNDLFNTKISGNVVRQVMSRYKIDSDYILFLSTLKPSKNIEGLLVAYSLLFNSRKDIKLVIAGKKGWLYESIFEKVKKLRLEDKVIFTDYVSEKEKAALIKGAKLFVLPSFWEGFGMDVVNSMACGTPVVVSNVGSLPEIAGKAAIYVDPYSSESIAQGIEKVFSMGPKEYNILVKSCLNQARIFSWQKSAEKTLSVLEKAKNVVHK
jgi:glycosyltransferase involved in cell wall biosynthesis